MAFLVVVPGDRPPTKRTRTTAPMTPPMGDDPDQIMMEIRSLQQSLTELQHQVIRGEVKPADYQRIERERIAKIHALEERLAAAMGTDIPERDTAL